MDLKIAELLTKYGIRGSFYVPCRNSEERKVLTDAQLRQISSNFEIGSHTLDHYRLDQVNSSEVQRQITEGKKAIEDKIGHKVNGFCYPDGKYNKNVCNIVAKAGFNYARTTHNLHINVLPNPFLMPTTIQLFPHDRNIYLRNFLKYGHWNKRIHSLKIVLNSENLFDRLKAILDMAFKIGCVFHLWGHSWEIEEFNGWKIFENFLSYASKILENPNMSDNFSVYRHFFDQSNYKVS